MFSETDIYIHVCGTYRGQILRQISTLRQWRCRYCSWQLWCRPLTLYNISLKKEETKIQYKTQIFIKSWAQHDALTWWLIGMLVNVHPQIFISNFLGKNEKMYCFMKRIFPKKKKRKLAMKGEPNDMISFLRVAGY